MLARIVAFFRGLFPTYRVELGLTDYRGGYFWYASGNEGLKDVTFRTWTSAVRAIAKYGAAGARYRVISSTGEIVSEIGL